MRYGSREICNVVLKDIVTKEPKAYLESLTTSSLDIAGVTVFARGGRGHAKLIGWDSEKDITMNMEDALISKASLEVLTGSKFAITTKPVHQKEVGTVATSGTDKVITLTKEPTDTVGYKQLFYKSTDGTTIGEKLTGTVTTATGVTTVTFPATPALVDGDKVIADYYVDASANAQTLTIASDIFPGYYLLEGETLWRNENGVDVPAIYTIPKLKIQPNFSIAMASSGDPQPFTFTADVFKDTSSTAMVILDVLE